MKTSPTTSFLSASLLSLCLAACGGGSVGSDGTVSGTVTGLGTGLNLALQNNGVDTVTLTSNGAFAFATKLPSLGPFSITVLTQPIGQFCTLARATGVIPTDGNQANITVVACAANSLGVVTTGLTAGSAVTLSNSALQIVVNSNGVSTFSGLLAGGTNYALAVAVQPTSQVCTLSNASGTITAGVQSLATLSCI